MNPAQIATVMMNAMMKGNTKLVDQCLRYTAHMMSISKEVENNEFGVEQIVKHSMRCSLCFSFQMRSGGLIPIEDYWKAMEEQNQIQSDGPGDSLYGYSN